MITVTLASASLFCMWRTLCYVVRCVMIKDTVTGSFRHPFTKWNYDQAAAWTGIYGTAALTSAFLAGVFL